MSCVYRNCTNTSRNMSMFTFPVHDKDRLNLWIINSGNTNLTSLTEYELSNRRVCSAHFRPACVHQGLKRSRLLGPAVPIPYQQIEHLKTSNVSSSLKVKIPVKVYERKKTIKQASDEQSSSTSPSLRKETTEQASDERSSSTSPSLRIKTEQAYDEQSNSPSPSLRENITEQACDERSSSKSTSLSKKTIEQACDEQSDSPSPSLRENITEQACDERSSSTSLSKKTIEQACDEQSISTSPSLRKEITEQANNEQTSSTPTPLFAGSFYALLRAASKERLTRERLLFDHKT